MSYRSGNNSSVPSRTGAPAIVPKKSLKRPERIEISFGASDQLAQQKPIRLWVKVLLVFMIVAALIGATGVGILAAWMSEAPPLDLDQLQSKSSSIILDVNGNYYQELDVKEKRVPVGIDMVPEMVQIAFVSMEDQRFYSHLGIDIRGTAKAVITVLSSGSTDGPGGSTLTQQLIKMTHLTSDKMVTRKAQEWKLAYELERKIGKRQIIEAYLNKANMSQTWGIESASNFFFGVSSRELSLAQTAVLTSIVNLPTAYNPYIFEINEEGDRVISKEKDEAGNPAKISYNPENRSRSLLVIGKMLELGHISQREHDIAQRELMLNDIGLQVPDSENVYSYFTDECYRQVIRDLAEETGMSIDDAAGWILNGGFTIKSTIDPDIQAALDHQAGIDSNFPEQTSEARRAGAAKAKATGDDNFDYVPQVAGVIIENSTGYVVGIVGGRGDKVSLGLNRAARPFSIGSTTKPITVYAPGFDRGTLTLATTFDNNKLVFPGGYKPNNYPNTYTGMTTTREAIKNSINVVALLSLSRIGIETSVEYAERFGLSIEHPDPVNRGKAHDHALAPLALGAYTQGQSMLALASAFSTFPNRGTRVEPAFYTEVIDPSGKVVVSSNKEHISVISEQAAWITTNALSDVVKGGTTTLSIPGQEIAGKTGTTSDNNNVLFAGFTERYTGAFWFGYDELQYRDPATRRLYTLKINTSSGRERSPARFWQAVFTEFYASKKMQSAKLPSMPQGISSRSVDKVSGKRPTNASYSDPRGSFVSNEYFIDGTYPSQSDDIHVYATVCSVSRQRAGPYCPATGSRVLLDKSPAKIYPPGVSVREPGFVPPPEAGYVIGGSTCSIHASYYNENFYFNDDDTDGAYIVPRPSSLAALALGAAPSSYSAGLEFHDRALALLPKRKESLLKNGA
ncbi:MAG: transglycosylase domain-containing protein [Eubacteriaceae bacterium]|nr:transglycosylase domain-containing protein [Eubacteriaceae bacterium]